MCHTFCGSPCFPTFSSLPALPCVTLCGLSTSLCPPFPPFLTRTFVWCSYFLLSNELCITCLAVKVSENTCIYIAKQRQNRTKNSKLQVMSCTSPASSWKYQKMYVYVANQRYHQTKHSNWHVISCASPASFSPFSACNLLFVVWFWESIDWWCESLCCSVLQCVAVCCSVLQCVPGDLNHLLGGRGRRRGTETQFCSVLQCVAVYCSVLQCIVVCCIVLQCTAICCSLLRSVVVCCSLLDCISTVFGQRW